MTTRNTNKNIDDIDRSLTIWKFRRFTKWKIEIDLIFISNDRMHWNDLKENEIGDKERENHWI